MAFAEENIYDVDVHAIFLASHMSCICPAWVHVNSVLMFHVLLVETLFYIAVVLNVTFGLHRIKC